MSNYLVVGAGLSGLTIANRLAQKSTNNITILEKNDHIGGNLRDRKSVNGDYYIHSHGPHIFHTNSTEIWNFIREYSAWNRYEHRVNSIHNNLNVNFPINLNSLRLLYGSDKANYLESKIRNQFGQQFEISIVKIMRNRDLELQKFGEDIFQKFYLNYTKKQWGQNWASVVDKVTSRVKFRNNRDDRFFTDTYQCLPKRGYTQFLENLVNYKNIDIKYSELPSISEMSKFDHVFYTGSIDELLDYRLGHLEYRSLVINKLTKKDESRDIFFTPQTNLPSHDLITRVTNYSLLTSKPVKNLKDLYYEMPIEYQIDKSIRYYPVDNLSSREMYIEYLKIANTKKFNITFAGRLGLFKYFNMDQIIANALQISKKFI
jgi:UDP-galactopyranose mutase